MRQRLVQVGIYISVVIVAAILALVTQPRATHTPSASQSSNPQSTATPSTAASTKSGSLDHVFIIVEENQPYDAVIGNKSAPYINSLAGKYSLATNYLALTHPSLPNYLELTSASDQGVTSDCSPPSAGCEVNAVNIADGVEKAGRSWRAYMESMPSSCYAFNSGTYATKHNPFVYYVDIMHNTTRCANHIVSFTQLSSDLSSAQSTPNYVFITPDLCNDTHDCSVSTGDDWLARNVPLILGSPAFTTQNSLLVVTWDEGNSTTNHIPTVLAGSAVKTSYQSTQYYNHYSLLHTIEHYWGIPAMTSNDSQAPLMTEFFK